MSVNSANLDLELVLLALLSCDWNEWKEIKKRINALGSKLQQEHNNYGKFLLRKLYESSHIGSSDDLPLLKEK